MGDYATVYAVWGRWDGERGGAGGGGSITCGPCNIPTEDLAISWTNLLTGNGSATMTYTTGPTQWETGCVDNGVQFRLSCVSNTIQLQASFFTSGECPTGGSNYCSNLRFAPLTLDLSDSTCSPFSLTFTVTNSGCPAIYSLGNVQFVVTL